MAGWDGFGGGLDVCGGYLGRGSLGGFVGLWLMPLG